MVGFPKSGHIYTPLISSMVLIDLSQLLAVGFSVENACWQVMASWSEIPGTTWTFSMIFGFVDRIINDFL